MNVVLTNYGLRYAAERCKEHDSGGGDGGTETQLLLELRNRTLVPYRGQPEYDKLLTQGVIERVSETLHVEDVALRYRRNPLQHVDRVVFEYTTRCNFNCRHCYNARVKRVTTRDVDVLKSAVDVFVRIGVRQFDFVGGEVSRYGDGWSALVRHIAGYNETTVTLATNGWWLGQTDFAAAGCRFPEAKAYLAHLKESGLSHVVFSLDGQCTQHDHSRRHPGLYKRIMEGIDLVHEAGLEPRVSLLVRGDEDKANWVVFLADLAERIYPCSTQYEPVARAKMLAEDPINIVSNLIDVGNGARCETGRFSPFAVDASLLYCKGFFRPSPRLTLKANGELATCRVANAGEGYGNLHDQDLVQILNGLQNQFVFKLHAERRIAEYCRFLDTTIFGERFAHMCTLRAILTMIARNMETEQVDPGDEAAIRRINRNVARRTGHLQS